MFSRGVSGCSMILPVCSRTAATDWTDTSIRTTTKTSNLSIAFPPVQSSNCSLTSRNRLMNRQLRVAARSQALHGRHDRDSYGREDWCDIVMVTFFDIAEDHWVPFSELTT